MKYIIVGLGNFGASLAQKLTAQGNEVIGIDTSMTKVDMYKEKSLILFVWTRQTNLQFRDCLFEIQTS